MDKSSTNDYKLTQVFGDKTSADKVSDQDIISSVKFDKNGKYLSLGDRAGRLIIFDMQQAKGKKHAEFSYYTEVQGEVTQLQSHVKEFDPLRSVETEEKINDISWMRPQGKNLYVLTTNNKTIKLWKLSNRMMKKVVKSAGKELAMPKLQVVEDGLVPTLIKSFPGLHTSNINSISNSNNEEYVLSSDDFKIYLWNVQEPNKAFIPVQIKPQNPDQPNQIITSSTFHPTSDSLFAYTTSKGLLKMADMRISAVCDNTAISFLHETSTPKNFFTEIIASYSSATFTKNERFLATRDLLNVKIWDLAMSNKPTTVIPVNESLKSKLCEMYENEQIFQRFTLSGSCESRHLVTGDWNSMFHVVDVEGNNSQYELNYNRRTICKQITNKIETMGPMDYVRKTLRTCFHPTMNTAVVACLNCFFIYNI